MSQTHPTAAPRPADHDATDPSTVPAETPAAPVTTAVSDRVDESLAIISPGDRTDRLTGPLEAVGADYTVNPSDPAAADLVICDTPDRAMLKTVVRCRLAGTPVLFRMRGDPFWGIEQWLDSRVKQAVLFRMLKAVDGCLAIAPHQATKYARKTGVPTDLVSLPKRAVDWPDTIHETESLRLLTLTNAVYPEKIQPTIEALPVVDAALGPGDRWRIGSWSEGHADRLRDAVAPYDRIEFETRLDAHAELEDANLMVHLSRLDVLPNAMLEGLASRLPVITNDFVAFEQSSAPLAIARSEADLESWLEGFRTPRHRQEWGDRGQAYVSHHHAPDRIGAQLLNATKRLLDR